MNKLSEKQLLANLERFYDLIDKYLPDSERTKKLKSFYKSIETMEKENEHRYESMSRQYGNQLEEEKKNRSFFFKNVY